MTELNTLRGIGEEMETKLKSIGISSAEDLVETGSENAFLRLKMKHPNVCLVHLQVLEGAITDVEYNQLSEEAKTRLKDFSDSLKD